MVRAMAAIRRPTAVTPVKLILSKWGDRIR